MLHTRNQIRYLNIQSQHIITIRKTKNLRSLSHKDGINTEYKRIVKENRNLEIITYDSKDNHRELHDALEELVPMVEDERTRIAKEMDW